MISETNTDMDFILSIFKIRLLTIIGFRPRIEECTSCKTKENLKYFSIRDNGFKCTACSKQDKSSIEMTQSTMQAIKYITLAPAKKIYSFNLKDESLSELKLISKIYLNEKLEKEYKISELF